MKVSIPDCFMTAFAAGLIFGLVYETLRVVRLLLRFKYAVFVCDVAFFVLAAEAVCRLSGSLGNYVRLYTVLGFGAGIFTYIVTIGRLFNLLESAVIRALRRAAGRICRKISGTGRKIVSKIAQKSKAAFVQVNNYLRKISKRSRQPLKTDAVMVYNNEGKYMSEKGEVRYVIKANVTKNR